MTVGLGAGDAGLGAATVALVVAVLLSGLLVDATGEADMMGSALMCARDNRTRSL